MTTPQTSSGPPEYAPAKRKQPYADLAEAMLAADGAWVESPLPEHGQPKMVAYSVTRHIGNRLSEIVVVDGTMYGRMRKHDEAD